MAAFTTIRSKEKPHGHSSYRSGPSAAAALSALAPAVFAADAVYPNRPIRLIVPFGAGGSTDMVAPAGRQDGPHTGQGRGGGQQGGAGGSIGASEIAKAAPDGYTIGMATVSTHGANPAIFPSCPMTRSRTLLPSPM
jgi:tripartite-type tricarboxylate transporter receptor subunit TctC